ncbi:MAG: 3D-(3,5/4)-trihydroxycyclohexane-1,2-dione acylhydrolase (decyclizing), partial [bacterium]
MNRPEQLLNTLPNVIQTILDPADCGPVFLALPQDVQVETYDFPDEFFEETIHNIRRPKADENSIKLAVSTIKLAKKPLIIAGGGARYSKAHKEISDFANKFAIPVVETVA